MRAAIIIVAALLAGCAGGVVQRERFELRTVDGRAFSLVCPVITEELLRSMSYATAGSCVIVAK